MVRLSARAAALAVASLGNLESEADTSLIVLLTEICTSRPRCSHALADREQPHHQAREVVARVERQRERQTLGEPPTHERPHRQRVVVVLIQRVDEPDQAVGKPVARVVPLL
jgi:hypothetical protein